MDDVAKFAPTFQFEIRDKYDFPSSLNFGEFVVDPRPSLYTHIKREDEWVFGYYCFYHYKDNHHRHDFTGAMSAYYNGVYHCSVLRSHFNLLLHYSHDGLPVFQVEAGTHAIKPGVPIFRHSHYTPSWAYNTVILGNPDRRDQLESAIGPWATPPWLWDDTRLRTRLARKYMHGEWGLTKSRGLIWTDPKILIHLLGKFGGKHDNRAGPC